MEGTGGWLVWRGDMGGWYGRDTQGNSMEGIHGSGTGWRKHRKSRDRGDTGRVGMEGTFQGPPLVPTAPSPSSSRPVSNMELLSEALSSMGQAPVRTELGLPPGAKALPRPRHHPARPRGPPLPSPTPPVPTRSGTAAVPARPALLSRVQLPACLGWAGWGHQQGRRRHHHGPVPWRGEGRRE